MLSLIVWWPLVVALVLVAAPALSVAASRWVFVAATTVELALILGMWFVYETPAAGTLPSASKAAMRRSSVRCARCAAAPAALDTAA